MKKTVLFAVVGLILTSCGGNSGDEDWTIESFSKKEGTEIKNVILMISDGTSKGNIDIARDISGKPLVIDQYMNGKVITASNTTLSYEEDLQDDNPTDSAAAGTAMATGHKTTNRQIGRDENQDFDSVAYVAKNEKNMKVGLVTTVSLLDATPAAFYAHNEERSNADDIYQSILQTDYDVLIGELNLNGGNTYRKSDFTDIGYSVVENLEELNAITEDTPKLVGHFVERYDAYLKNNGYARITDYTAKTLDLLDHNNDNGFFLMIEGGTVDHANHNWNGADATLDFLAFNEACKIVLDYAKARTDTAVIITSDHGNGGIKYTKGHKKYDAKGTKTLEEYFEENTEYTVYGHTNEDVYLASYIPAGITRIAGNKQKIQNTTIAYYIDKLLDLNMFTA